MTARSAAPGGLTVRVEHFEGPLDLLLHLCRTNEVDLPGCPSAPSPTSTSPISSPCASRTSRPPGSFMVMAATLIYLKSKLLLPPTGEPGEDELDPEGELLRQELAARLGEYARVKALGGVAGRARGRAGAPLRAHRRRAAAAGGHPAPGPLRAPPDARHQPAHRGAEARAAPRGGAQPALGARAHERDPVPPALDVVAPLLVGGGRRARPRRVGGDPPRAARDGAAGPGARPAVRALRRHRDRARRQRVPVAVAAGADAGAARGEPA